MDTSPTAKRSLVFFLSPQRKIFTERLSCAWLASSPMGCPRVIRALGGAPARWPIENFTILNNQVKKMLYRNRVIEYVAHITVNSDDAVGSMERDCCVIKKVFLVFGEEKPLFLKGQRRVKRIRLSSVAKFLSAFDIHASRPDPLDRLFFDVFVGVNFSFLHAPQKGFIFLVWISQTFPHSNTPQVLRPFYFTSRWIASLIKA